MPKDPHQQLTLRETEKLLNNQTLVILSAVEEKLEKSEERINQKIERLIDTLDKFLKRTTDLEEEFELMKHDLNRIKRIVQEKLGVELI